ncbi:MAG: DNA/RNA nuclease SfsA [Oligoflexia bacterium]|nr:DNA/RNA nuclease SfsA [Oligoflexia bacterium]
MQLDYPLITATFHKREKRFFAHCSKDGKKIIAHCANPGSMKGNLEEGTLVKLLDYGKDHLKSGRKLRYKWILSETKEGTVVLDTTMANKIVEEALLAKKIKEVSQYKELQREKTFAASRFDFCLGLEECYLEVKSVSMVIDDVAAFPDSVTARGAKHLQELIEVVRSGRRAVNLFLIMRPEFQKMRIAKEIDEKYYQAFVEAKKAGVEFLAYNIRVENNQIVLDKKGKVLDL